LVCLDRGLGLIWAIKESRPIIYRLNIFIFLIKNPEVKTESRSSVNAEAKAGKSSDWTVRVLVEHAIGGMKVFRVLPFRLRNHLKHLADDFIFATAGLWNLKNSFVVQ